MAPFPAAATAIPVRRRLAVRHAVPIVTAILLVSISFLAAGYLYASNQVLDGVERQTAQLAGSVNRYDGHYRKWLEANIIPVVRLLEKTGPYLPLDFQFTANELGTLPSHSMGQEEIIVRTVDLNGVYRARRWSRQRAGEVSSATEGLGWIESDMADILAAIGNSAGWHGPSIADSGQESEMRLRYSVPLRYPLGSIPRQQEPNGDIFGVLTMTVSMPWFEERIKSIKSLRNSIVFLLAPDGQWTLPRSLSGSSPAAPNAAGREAPEKPASPEPADSAALADMKQRILLRQPGTMPISVQGEEYVAVFTPLSMKNFMLGMLIPRDVLFGALNRLTLDICLVAGAVLCLAIAILINTSLRMLKPLNALAQVADRMAVGDSATVVEEMPQTRAFMPDEPGRLMRASVELRGTMLGRTRELTSQALARERIAGEFRLAADIQDGLLPPSLPSSDRIAVRAAIMPGKNGGGEIYDCFSLQNGRVCCILASANASGVPGALLIGGAVPLLQELLLSGLGPAQALSGVNDSAFGYGRQGQSQNGQFVNIVAAVIDPFENMMNIAGAGGAVPILVRPEAVVDRAPLDSGEASGLAVREVSGQGLFASPPVGERPGTEYRDDSFDLMPGDAVFFFSGKLLNAQSPDGQAFGRDRLAASLRRGGTRPDSLIRSVRASVFEHARGGLGHSLAVMCFALPGGRR